MSPTEFYEEVVMEFPLVHPEDHEWVNVHDGRAPKLEAIAGLVDRYINSPEVVVIVHSEPGIGATLPKASVARYIAGHILKHEIVVSDSLFACFVAVSCSGVATGWHLATRRHGPAQ
jgi:hypothetical protein